MRIAIGDAEIHGIADLRPFPLPLIRLLPDADRATLEEVRPILAPDHLDHVIAVRDGGLRLLASGYEG